MLKCIRGLAALAALAALVAGVPAALARFVGRPWPSPFPPIAVVWESVRRGDISDAAVIKFLAIIVWLAWARLVISVAIEIGSKLAGRKVPRIAGLGSAQQWAASLVAALTLLVPSGSRFALAAPEAPVRPIPAALLHLGPLTWSDPLEGPASTETPSSLREFEAAGPAGRSGAPAAASDAPAAPIHVVLRHESFWSIAQDALGDGARWREIVELNAGREVAPGITFDGTPDRLQPGWQLLVPDAATVAAAPLASWAPSAGATHEVIVERGDTLSGIAADELGDANAWHAVWDLNKDRTFGDRTFDDPNLILPGWKLVVPSPVASSSATPTETIPDSDPDLSVDDTDAGASVPTPTPTSTAETTVPATATPATATPTTGATGDSVSSEPAEPVTPTVMEDPPSAPAEIPPTGSVAPAEPAASEPIEIPWNEHGGPSVAGLGAAVLVASGVVGAIGMRRRRRLRGAAVNARLAPIGPPPGDIDRVLRDLDDGERVARLDIALRAAAHELAAVGPGVVVLALLATVDGQVDLLLSGAAAPPSPWETVSDHRWRLPAGVGLNDIADSARHSQQPCPALAHLGATRLDNSVAAEVFVDLEAVGLLAVDGSPMVADAIVRAIAASVAVSPLAESALLVTSGLDDLHLGHPSTQDAESLQTALDVAARAVGATSVVAAGSLSTFALRSRPHAGEAWEPAVVFGASSSRPGAQLDGELVERAGPGGRGLAVVVAGEVVGATWSLRPDADKWVLHPLGLEIVPIGLSSGEVDELQRMLDEADRELLAPDEPLVDGDDRTMVAPATLGADDVEMPQPSWALMVRVLGRPAVSDAEDHQAPFERSKALELVVWLSQHRERATRSGARTALWESNVRDATFANVVSDARRSLARLVPPANGEEWIGRTLTDDLPLHSGVITDAELLADRLRTARGLAPDEAIAMLRPALAMVRDIPFAGSAYLWPDTEGITSQLILLVTSAAAVLAESALSLGDVEGVFWATGQGLKVLPGHEELIALRMRAHGREGDLAGVRNEWASYEKVLNAEVWGDGEPAPKLVALRRELLAPSLAAAAR